MQLNSLLFGTRLPSHAGRKGAFLLFWSCLALDSTQDGILKRVNSITGEHCLEKMSGLPLIPVDFHVEITHENPQMWCSLCKGDSCHNFAFLLE